MGTIKVYELTKDDEVMTDEDGSPIRFTATKDADIVIWMYQKAGELNGYKAGPHKVRVSSYKG